MNHSIKSLYEANEQFKEYINKFDGKKSLRLSAFLEMNKGLDEIQANLFLVGFDRGYDLAVRKLERRIHLLSEELNKLKSCVNEVEANK